MSLLDLNPMLEGKKVGRWINYIVNLSLESYLVQFIIIAGVASLNIVFPLNFIISIVLILVSAWILHIVSAKLTELMFQHAKSENIVFH